jgi:hypothetical protein
VVTKFAFQIFLTCHRYAEGECAKLKEELDLARAQVKRQGAIWVGRHTLTPPDPLLKGARNPGGFNPCSCHVKNRFQN